MSIALLAPAESTSASTRTGSRTGETVSWSDVSAEELGRFMKKALTRRGLRRIIACRRGDLRRARSDSAFHHVLDSSDLLLRANRRIRSERESRKDPFELTDLVFGWARDLNRRIYIVGGRGSEPFDWARRIRRRHPRLEFAGAYAPGPDLRDQEGAWRLVERLNRSEAEIVISVARSTLEEQLSARFAPRMDAHLHIQIQGKPPRSWLG